MGVKTTLFMRRMQALHQNPVPNNHAKHIISREGDSEGELIALGDKKNFATRHAKQLLQWLL